MRNYPGNKRTPNDRTCPLLLLFNGEVNRLAAFLFRKIDKRIINADLRACCIDISYILCYTAI